MYPWSDRSGRFSLLKAMVFALLFMPGAWIAVADAFGYFQPRPLKETTLQLGLWTIRLLFITLAITPLRQILQWPQLVAVRRMIGVAAFFYIATHFLAYVVDQAFDFEKVASEIVVRIYLTIGFAALSGLAVLAATSTDGMIRWLGGRRWQRLHRLVYVIGILAVTHFFMQSKADVSEPTVMAGLFAWLMGYRAIARFQRRSVRPPIWSLAALNLVAAAATAVGEAAYFWYRVGVDPMRVLVANFSLMAGLRPSWLVLAIGLAMTIAGALQPFLRRDMRASGSTRSPLTGRSAPVDAT